MFHVSLNERLECAELSLTSISFHTQRPRLSTTTATDVSPSDGAGDSISKETDAGDLRRAKIKHLASFINLSRDKKCNNDLDQTEND